MAEITRLFAELQRVDTDQVVCREAGGSLTLSVRGHVNYSSEEAEADRLADEAVKQCHLRQVLGVSGKDARQHLEREMPAHVIEHAWRELLGATVTTPCRVEFPQFSLYLES